MLSLFTLLPSTVIILHKHTCNALVAIFQSVLQTTLINVPAIFFVYTFKQTPISFRAQVIFVFGITEDYYATTTSKKEKKKTRTEICQIYFTKNT